MIGVIVDLDVDVMFIEVVWLYMEVFDDLNVIGFVNGVGLGVYDIYLLWVFFVEEMVDLLWVVLCVVLVEWLWVNFDCGLKICNVDEVIVLLYNMVVVVWEVCVG